jgi:LPXTG-site transpeptidase (sortase) family protein
MIDRAPRPSRAVSRRAAILLAAVIVVGLGAVLAISVGSGPGTTPSPTPDAGGTAFPGFTDLGLVTVPPTAAVTPTPFSATAAPTPDSGTAATPAAAQGIRADRTRIARLGIDLAIIEGDGIDAPIGKAAHYPGSAWPGAGSNTYIYGHAREGMFIALWEARVGDAIELHLVDGTTRTYVVRKVLPKVPWDAVQFLEPTTTEQLTVQTSTSYRPTAPRFVVVAVPAS